MTLYNLFVYALIYALIYWSRKKKLHYISYTNFIFEVINIDFWQIWHFDVKVTRWVGLQLSVILTQTVGRFDMWVVPNLKWKWLPGRKNNYVKKFYNIHRKKPLTTTISNKITITNRSRYLRIDKVKLVEDSL